MKNSKTDQRSKYTQMLIKKGLLKLIMNKPLNKITITELCAAAGTNRITFYNHFYDIYDVYETMENDFYVEIMERLEPLKTFAADSALIQEIIMQLYRNTDMCNLLVNTHSNLISKIMNAVHEKCVAEFSLLYTQIPISLLNQLFTFLLNGYVGLIIDWVKNGMKQQPEEISRLMYDFNKYSLDGFVKNFLLGKDKL